MKKIIFIVFVLGTSCSDEKDGQPADINTTDSATIAYPPASTVPPDTNDHNLPGASTIALDSPVGPQKDTVR